MAGLGKLPNWQKDITWEIYRNEVPTMAGSTSQQLNWLVGGAAAVMVVFVGLAVYLSPVEEGSPPPATVAAQTTGPVSPCNASISALESGRTERADQDVNIVVYQNRSQMDVYGINLKTDKLAHGTLAILWREATGEPGATGDHSRIVCQTAFGDVESQAFYNPDTQREESAIIRRLRTDDFFDSCPSASYFENCNRIVEIMFFPDNQTFYWSGWDRANYPR
ncbi:MAG: hypothetical protein HYT80_05245 [Euryarchaeota archaeon]|nr:hypothetical protein [Euryarchaeota archaeon]